MAEPERCPACGGPLAPGGSLCPGCGHDLSLDVWRPARPRLRPGRLALRLLVWSLVVLIPAFALLRLRVVGPGPDLPTTLRWMLLGDGGRAAELVTIHRAHEIATAAARYATRELEPPPAGDGWAETLAPYATMHVRGWIPLLFAAADADLAPAPVREMYLVRPDDGWNRPYRLSLRELPAGAAADDPQVAADLAAGLQTSFFTRGTPDVAGRDFVRLELVSAGRDGEHGTGDDLALVSYVPVSRSLRLTRDVRQIERELEEAFVRGQHYFRVDGSRFDLIDARLLAEARLDLVL